MIKRPFVHHPIAPSEIAYDDGYDLIRLFLDRPELPFPVSKLQPHCYAVSQISSQPKYQSNRKLGIEIFQPTLKCLEVLREGLGQEVGVDIVYAEIGRDVIHDDQRIIKHLEAAFLECAEIPYFRDLVLPVEKTTWYFSRRKPIGHVLAMYADKPSKLNNSRPNNYDPACLHIEWRTSGKKPLQSIGISSLDDLINFDFDRHWKDRLKLHDIPSRTKLGKLLAMVIGGMTDASATAHLKRANTWLNRHRKLEKFVLQNALTVNPEMAIKLPVMTWLEWLYAYTNE
jgi:hypothetical protein